MARKPRNSQTNRPSTTQTNSANPVSVAPKPNVGGSTNPSKVGNGGSSGTKPSKN